MTVESDTPNMTAADHGDLMDAVRRLEHVGLAMRVSNMVGKQISLVRRFAPEKAAGIVNAAAGAAMRVAFRAAVASLQGNAQGKAPANSNRAHKAMVAASGAAGGALGLASLPFELPVTATLMLRSIADIARAEGETLADPETALACMEVFALDGRVAGLELAESGYFAIRGLLARSISEAAAYVASRSLIDESAPVLIKLTTQLASRFGLVVTQKMLAQATPILGALGGAAINIAFMDHFQSLAKGHFTVRRLERKYGADFVRGEYERLAAAREPDEIKSPAA